MVVIRGTQEEINEFLQTHIVTCVDPILPFNECTKYVDSHTCYLCLLKNETRYGFEVTDN